MASFDENGKYIKTDWKTGDKITATKLNKIEESIEAVNDNDISRHVEADTRLDALEAKDVAHDKEFTNVRNLIADNKAAAELGDYEINSRMTFLEDDVEQAVNNMNNAVTTMRNEMNNTVTTMRNEMNTHTNTVNTNVNNKISAFETEFNAEVAGLKAVDEAIQNDVSEIQNDMTNAQTQSFTVTDVYKFIVNHDGMMPSLVTFNNIEGLSSVETNSKGNKEIVSRSVNHICTIDKSKNYFDDAVQDTLHGDTTTATRENNDITVISSTQYGAAAYSIPNLEEGKKYCILCDDIIITQGDAHFQAATPVEYKPLRSTTDLKLSQYNAVFIGNEICTATFHCSRVSNSGNVTYKNVQIYEVKEMIVPDIQLNSLPNGVIDEIKDGMLIKRTNQVNLKDLAWVTSSTNDGANDYKVYYTQEVTDIKWTTDHYVSPNTILCNMLPCTSNAGTEGAQDPVTQYQTPGISSHIARSELRIKVKASDAPDLNSLYTWLNNNNVTIVYEMQSYKYEDVNLTIKADKGDTVVINTTKTMDLTYDIQLNTRAQLNSIQDLVGSHKHGEYLPLSGGTMNGNLETSAWRINKNTNGYQADLISKHGNWGIQSSDGVRLGYSASYKCFNPSVKGEVTLGTNDYRWRDLYLSNAMNIKSGTSECGYLWNRIYNKTESFFIRGGSNDDGIWINSNGRSLNPHSNNSWNLGLANNRWQYIYTKNAVNVSSDRSLKENIEYVKNNTRNNNVTYNEMYDFVKKDLELATYNFIGEDKQCMNFIAQDLLVNEDGTDNKVGQMIVNPVAVPTEEEIAEGKPYPTLSYDSGMYISVLAGALKEAINKIEQLEAKINELKNK